MCSDNYTIGDEEGTYVCVCATEERYSIAIDVLLASLRDKPIPIGELVV